MKGDYSQLMPGRYLKQIELPSAYLVYAVGRRLRRRQQLTPGGASFRIPLFQSDAAWEYLAKLQLLLKSHDADCFSIARRNRQNLALVYFPVRRPNIFDPRERVEKSWVELRHPVFC
jgi:hypothetical protein